MAIISLREYVREIQNLIEGRNELEAIEHCKHILKKFPKHLDTYRLLGQAYLEANRYQEAVDLFLRVLSVIPEDFIAHLGLSVVNEEENNLDAAIWHMERAYEIRSTETIHEELQRLFSMRDGFAPPKPYITRGALIRINIRSGLYQQALAEIQHALQEDPQRMDLMILRARIYYMQNNMARSVETCKMVLEKLPYSYDANSIMAEILGNSEKADPYKLRLHELDPYTTYVNLSTTIDQVSDHAVGIEYLEEVILGDSNMPDFSHEDNAFFEDQAFLTEEYSQTIPSDQSMESTIDEDGINLEHQTFTFGNDPEETNMSESKFEDAPEDELIPEWMKDAGWEQGDAKTEDEEQKIIHAYDSIDDVSDMVNTPEVIDESEMPEWLRNFSPPETVAEESDEEEKLIWLNDILTQESATQPKAKPGLDITDQEEEPVELPESLSQPIFGENINADLEWLEQISTTKNPAAEGTSTNEQLEDQEAPDELAWLTPAAEETISEVEDDFKSIKELDNDELEQNNGSISEPIVDTSTSTSAETMQEDEDFDFDSALAWLEGLAAKQGADEETLSTAPDTRQEEAPEWITAPSHPESLVKITQDTELTDYNPDQEAVPDWLLEPGTIEETVIVESALEFEEGSFEELPVWMKTVSPPEHVEEEVSLPDHESESIFSTVEAIDEEQDLSESVEEWYEKEPLVDNPFEEETVLLSSQEQLQTTAVLDFIKSTEDMDSDEIDHWLENLPELEDWDTVEKQTFAFQQEMEQQQGMAEPEMEPVFEELHADELILDELVADREEELEEETKGLMESPSTSFIDEFFADDTQDGAVESEKLILPTEVGDEPPYQWEQEFSGTQNLEENEPYIEEDLPDWIADIPDTNFLSMPEKLSEPVGMPEEFLEEFTDKTFNHDAVMDETMPIPVSELVEQPPIGSEFTVETKPDFVSGDIAITQEADRDILLAVNDANKWLNEGSFDRAHPILQKTIEQGKYLDQVIETLLFDINHYHPIEVNSWILLGDAYFKQGNLSKALDAYTKAEDFIN